MEKVKKIRDVHTGHCCTYHGCKYGDETCTVTTGLAHQEGPCEQCGLDLEYYGPEEQREASRRLPDNPRDDEVRMVSKVGYMCKVAFDEELGRDRKSTRLNSSHLG